MIQMLISKIMKIADVIIFEISSPGIIASNLQVFHKHW